MYARTATRARPAPPAPRIKRPVIKARLIPLLLLWLSGACLRITVLATPPVIPALHADLHLSETQIGWLSSLPPMLFAIAAVPGSLLIARFGLLPALLAGLLLTALGGAARGAIPDATFLFASTIVMAAGVAIMQPILPPLVRAWFPKAIGFATAVYTLRSTSRPTRRRACTNSPHSPGYGFHCRAFFTVDAKTTMTMAQSATGAKLATGMAVKSHSQPPTIDSSMAQL